MALVRPCSHRTHVFNVYTTGLPVSGLGTVYWLEESEKKYPEMRGIRYDKFCLSVCLSVCSSYFVQTAQFITDIHVNNGISLFASRLYNSHTTQCKATTLFVLRVALQCVARRAKVVVYTRSYVAHINHLHLRASRSKSKRV